MRADEGSLSPPPWRKKHFVAVCYYTSAAADDMRISVALEI